MTLSIMTLSITPLDTVMLSVANEPIMLSVVRLNVVMLSVVRLNVVMLSVVAPSNCPTFSLLMSPQSPRRNLALFPVLDTCSYATVSYCHTRLMLASKARSLHSQ